MQIIIKTFNGHIYTLNADKNTTIRDLKRQIQAKCRIEPLERLCLLFGGTQLSDHQTLKDYNITKQAVLQLIIKTSPIKIPKSKHSISFYDEYRLYRQCELI